jgi:outer membrane protein OmpA-like peptidoglycan-associated protein
MKKFFAVIFFGILCLPLFAQTAAELEELLKTQTVNYGQAARFALEAANAAKLKDHLAAYSFAAERKWLPKKVQAGDAARLDRISLLLMRSFNVKGGLWYSITKSPHFAYNELVYKDVIQGIAYPSMTVSGEQFLFMINRLLALYENTLPPDEEISTEKTAAQEKEEKILMDTINTQIEALAIADTTARVTEEGITISLSNIQFLANSSRLPESEKKKIREIAEILKKIPARKIIISGHTAEAGTERNRMRTSIERAQAVANYLIQLGARKASEIEVRGYGSTRPIADNNTKEGMALNRRVEFTIVGDNK